MEFDFNINELFPSEIVKLNHELIRSERRNPCRLLDGSFQLLHYERLALVIDRMGDASAQAQGLHCCITTYEKLRQSDHTLYVMKDEQANDKGVIVGILKIGEKRLFLLDSKDNQHEMHPICVLDFYIHESYQRKGCGKRLFEFMLKDKSVGAADLAIDRPSNKLLGFLNKHYHLSKPIHQRNHFTVYEGIFSKIAKQAAEEPKSQTWGRGRYSDPAATRGSQEAEKSRSLTRQSYPPAVIKQSHSSVGSIVFGQPVSNTGHGEHGSTLLETNEEKHFRPLSLARQDQQRMDPKDYSENRSGIDSSLNIFGIPSPANRSSMDVQHGAGSSLQQDRQILY